MIRVRASERKLTELVSHHSVQHFQTDELLAVVNLKFVSAVRRENRAATGPHAEREKQKIKRAENKAEGHER